MWQNCQLESSGSFQGMCTLASEAMCSTSCISCLSKILKGLGSRHWWYDWGRVGVIVVTVTKHSSIIMLNSHTARDGGSGELCAVLEPLISMLHLNDERRGDV